MLGGPAVAVEGVLLDVTIGGDRLNQSTGSAMKDFRPREEVEILTTTTLLAATIQKIGAGRVYASKLCSWSARDSVRKPAR